MGKKSASVQAPDPVKTAQAQGAANKDAAIASAEINMLGQNSPYGNVSYQQTGTTSSGTPQYTQNVSLDPSQQRQLGLSNQLSENALNTGLGLWQNITNATKNPFQIAGQPALPSDYSADRDKIQNDLYDRSMSRLEPQFQRDQNALENKLVNQGLTRGSEAFNDAEQQQQYGVNDARNSAMQSAISQAGNEQSRLFGLNMQGRQQGIQEQALERSQPINEVATLLGLGGSVTPPQFSSPSQVGIQPADVTGNTWNAYQAQQNATNQRNQQTGNLFGLAGTLGSAYLLSDRTFKENIQKVGEWNNGLNVYTFNYIDSPEPQIGFMADEVEKLHPSAIKEIFGVKYVNYGEACK